MADLLTVYEDDQANSYIDCTICNKRIRGESQYKVHLTTLPHLKKEEALVANGSIPRPPPLPKWTNIKDYLRYLNLDEPIIGLNALAQAPDVVTEDGKKILKYRCKMCLVEMDLYSMVAHVVGRKHRQKYLEIKRPDLVTWYAESAQKQPGLVARAKAAVVEKQEGWGTPEPLKRPQEKFKSVPQAGPSSQSSVREQPYLERDYQRRSSADEDRQPYLNQDRYGRSYSTREKYDQYEEPSTRSYPEHAVRGTLREEYSDRARRDVNAKPYGDQGGGRRTSEEGYDDGSRGKRQYSSGHYDIQENEYDDGGPRNRYNDRDLRLQSAGQHSGDTKYQGQMDGRMYSSYEERGPGLNAMPKRGRSFNETEKRGNFSEFDSWIQSTLSEEQVSAKKRKKSRFSDATADELALANTRYFDKPGQRPQNSQRGPPYQGIPSLFDIPVMDSGSTSNTNPNAESVLDVLNDIQIENMEDAKYLKEKLCTVLKEFQAIKGSRSGGHTSAGDYRGDKQMDQHRDAYENTPRGNPDGMYAENRRYDDNFQDSRQYEDDPRTIQGAGQYKDDPRMFQGDGQYEDDPRAYKDARQYKDDPRAYKDARKYEDDPRGSRETRRYEESSRDYRDYPSSSSFREASQEADDPRGYQETRLQDKTVDLSERRSFDHDLRGKYESLSRPSQDSRLHAEGMRSNQEARYYDNDFGGYGNVDSGKSWDQQRSSLDGTGPVDERGYQESFGKSQSSFKPSSQYGDKRMYAGRGQQRSHQDARHGGEELYDPFNPSSSPPPTSTNSTSLNKIASTLLELVSRR